MRWEFPRPFFCQPPRVRSRRHGYCVSEISVSAVACHFSPSPLRHLLKCRGQVAPLQQDPPPSSRATMPQCRNCRLETLCYDFPGAVRPAPRRARHVLGNVAFPSGALGIPREFLCHPFAAPSSSNAVFHGLAFSAVARRFFPKPTDGLVAVLRASCPVSLGPLRSPRSTMPHFQNRSL